MKPSAEPESVLTWGHTQVRDPFKTLLHALLDCRDARSTLPSLSFSASLDSIHFIPIQSTSIQFSLICWRECYIVSFCQSARLHLGSFITRCVHCCSNTFINLQTSSLSLVSSPPVVYSDSEGHDPCPYMFSQPH